MEKISSVLKHSKPNLRRTSKRPQRNQSETLTMSASKPLNRFWPRESINKTKKSKRMREDAVLAVKKLVQKLHYQARTDVDAIWTNVMQK